MKNKSEPDDNNGFSCNRRLHYCNDYYCRLQQLLLQTATTITAETALVFYRKTSCE